MMTDIHVSSSSSSASTSCMPSSTATPLPRSIVHPLQHRNHALAVPKAAPAKALAVSTSVYGSNTSAPPPSDTSANDTTSPVTSTAPQTTAPASGGDPFRATLLNAFDYARMWDNTTNQALAKKPAPNEPLVVFYDPADPTVSYESTIAGTTHDFLDIQATVNLYPTFVDFPQEQRPSRSRYELTRLNPNDAALKLRCPFCRGNYGGVNAKAIWERHVKDHWPKPGDTAAIVSTSASAVKAPRIPRAPRAPRVHTLKHRRNKSFDHDDYDEHSEPQESDMESDTPKSDFEMLPAGSSTRPLATRTRNIVKASSQESKNYMQGKPRDNSDNSIGQLTSAYFTHLPPSKSSQNRYNADENYHLTFDHESPHKPLRKPTKRAAPDAFSELAASEFCDLSEQLLEPQEPVPKFLPPLVKQPNFTAFRKVARDRSYLSEEEEEEDLSPVLGDYYSTYLKAVNEPPTWQVSSNDKKRGREEDEEDEYDSDHWILHQFGIEPMAPSYKRRRVMSIGSASSFLSSYPSTSTNTSDYEASLFDNDLDSPSADSPCVTTPPADSPLPFTVDNDEKHAS